MYNIKNCLGIYIMQGNHDVKEETGSALDLIRGMSPLITVVDKPFLFSFGKNDNYMYLLPHMKPFSTFGYSSIKSYGNEDFHRDFWKIQDYEWDDVKDKIKFVSIHGGDETTGKLFMNADISFIPGIRSNGHIHKQVSKNHLPSALVTRRDETDKKCFMRYIDTDTWTIIDKQIPLFLNYAQIPYGQDIIDYFASSDHIMPAESLIVDIYGHDDKDLVMAEYTQKWREFENPRIYIGEVTSTERKGDTVTVEERDELDISTINIKGLFKEFCEEKKLTKSIVDDLMGRLE